MPKFKCKECHKKFKVSSMEAASKEIECFKKRCPIVVDVKSTNYEPRSTNILEFTDWPPGEFNIITDWETPEPPKPTIYPSTPYNGVDVDVAAQQRQLFQDMGWPD